MALTEAEQLQRDLLTQKQLEEKNAASQKKGGVVGGVLGLLPSLAGAIPSIVGSPQKGALERQQRGEGVGATTARKVASDAGRRTAGNLGGRGSSGLVREGIASAERQGAEGAAIAARVGAQESAIATQILRQNDAERLATGLQLGAGIGGSVAAATANQVAAQDQGPAVDPEAAADPGAAAGPAGGELAPEAQQGVIDQGLGALNQVRASTGQDPATLDALPAPGGPQQVAQPPEAPAPETPATPEGPVDSFVVSQMIQSDAALNSALATREYVNRVARPNEGPLTSAGQSEQVSLDRAKAQTGQAVIQYYTSQAELYVKSMGRQGMEPILAQAKMQQYQQSLALKSGANNG